jgi:hypothetical protein
MFIRLSDDTTREIEKLNFSILACYGASQFVSVGV